MSRDSFVAQHVSRFCEQPSCFNIVTVRIDIVEVLPMVVSIENQVMRADVIELMRQNADQFHEAIA